ncbi:hypothetical protein CGCS363_v014519 [Colletotrichum siamense]|uniref:uncharacterized protein n=1 Tax=Colletotrichum siamense TaxID=690259 RepID=UPI0018721846|nr:uncharacterized protein CGCS363_v014519 [Colletotrichum siamense]KAF5485222.1 hypothetical protein CGCS363_v014519 [Colletotrichum siamense]
MVAERLGNVYEAALAELRVKGSLGRVSSTVVRADLLTPDLFKAIRDHLVAKDVAWATLRENTHESNVAYGIDKYDEARKAYLAYPTQIGSLGDDGPTFTRLWYLIDWWLELTTDGNPVLDVDNGTLIHVAVLDAAPMTTPVSMFVDGAGFQDQQNINVVNDSEVFDLTQLYESLQADTWDTFARENSLADLDPNSVPTTVSMLSSGASARDQQGIKVANESNAFDFASIYESLHTDA